MPGLVGDLPGPLDPAILADRKGGPAGNADARMRRVDSAVDDGYPDPGAGEAFEGQLQRAGW